MKAVRVEAGDGADGRLVGAKLCGQCIEELTAQAEVGEFQGRVLVVHPVDRHGGLVGLGREQCADVGLTAPHGLRFPQGASAADDAEPDTALVVLRGEDLDLSHLSGGGGVGAAAGADVRARDGHDAHLPGDLFFAAVGQRRQLFGGGVGDEHRHILPDDAVGGKLCLPQALGGDGDAGVHPHGVGADVEAHVLRPEHLVQDAGEDVLAGVLLHLVEAPLPVDGAGDGGTGLCRLGQGIHPVPDDAVRLVDVGDMEHRAVGEGQRASVGGLTAPFGVEHRAVQRDAPAARFCVRLCGQDDPGGSLAECVVLKIFFRALHGTIPPAIKTILSHYKTKYTTFFACGK